MKLYIDLETQSEVDLRKRGLEVYARGEHTTILCMSYAFGDEDFKIWKKGEELPQKIIKFIKEGGTVSAHNAQFEWFLWAYVGVEKFGWPTLKIEQMDCSMARCFDMALPGSLDGASKALGITQEKDKKGSRVMLQLSKPRGYDELGIPFFWTKEEYPEKFETLYSYCLQDTVVSREVDKRVLELNPPERKLWCIDQKINNRGVYIDIDSAKKAIDIVALEKKKLDERMKAVTKGAVTTCTKVADIKKWLWNHDIECDGVGKPELTRMLALPNLSEEVEEVLLLRRAAGKSSTAKLDAMVRMVGPDNRARNTMQYHAASTGRWGGRGIQVQNLPRPTLPQKEIDYIFEFFKLPPDIAADAIDMFYGDPIQRVSDCLRGFICAPPGKKLIAGDWSAIEARVIAWLAKEERVLEIFRGKGLIYEAEAAGIYNIHIDSVSKAQRQIGKVAVLALGFQGGKVAFQSMAKNYGVKVTDERAEEIKDAWRKNNPYIVKLWYDLERASFLAVKYPGEKFQVGKITYLVNGSFLWCQLPSERVLCYPYPELQFKKTPWGVDKEVVTFMTVDSMTKKWKRTNSYGGFLAENVTQAVARDLLAECLMRLEDAHFETVFHVHDEIVCEVDGRANLVEFENIMEVVPPWAEGLPMKAEAYVSDRYKK